MFDYLISPSQQDKKKIKNFRLHLEKYQKSQNVPMHSPKYPNFYRHFFDLCQGVLTYVDGLEQDIKDLRVVLGTTVEHSNEIERILLHQQEYLAGLSSQYEFILDSSTDWMCLLNNQFQYVAINDAFCQFQKKSKDSLSGEPFSKFWDTSLFQKRIKPALNKALRGREIREQVDFIMPDGRELYLDLTYYPFKMRGTPQSHVVFVARDISEHRLTEERLKEHEQFLHKIHDAIFIQDQNQIITFWNKTSELLFGWTEEEAIGKPATQLFINDSTVESYKLALKTVLADGEWSGQLHFKTKDQKEVVVDSRWTLLQDQDVQHSILVSNIDVTEKQRLELQFFRAQRTESIGALASGIAHDLNNVLTLFFMSIRALKPKLKDKQSRTILSLLEASSKRGVDLVRQIMNFARGIEGERMELDLAIIMMELESVMGRTFPKNIEISSDISKRIRQIFGNPTQIYQVLLNLSLNARDAMPEGGKLSIKADNVTLTEKDTKQNTVLKPGDYVLIQVKDTGVGIEQEIIEKIFDPFFTTKETGKGSGLGLTAVQSIVKRHHGSLAVKSKIGHGTTFYIYLPCF